jgi:hypothetical protein
MHGMQKALFKRTNMAVTVVLKMVSRIRQGAKCPHVLLVSCLVYSCTLKMEALCSSEMLGSAVNGVASQKDVEQSLRVLCPLRRLHRQQLSNLRWTGQQKLDLPQVLRSLFENSTREMNAASSSEVSAVLRLTLREVIPPFCSVFITVQHVYKYGCDGSG